MITETLDGFTSEGKGKRKDKINLDLYSISS